MNAMSNENLKTFNIFPENPLDVQQPSEKELIFEQWIEYNSVPDADKARILNIPFNEKTGRFEQNPSAELFAKKYGLAPSTLYRWKQRPEFRRARQVVNKKWGQELTPNVMASLYRRCMKYGQHEDVELWLAYFEGWDKKKVLQIKHRHEIFDMKDIRALLAYLPLSEQQDFYATIARIIERAELFRSRAQVSNAFPLESGTDSDDVRDETDLAA